MVRMCSCVKNSGELCGRLITAGPEPHTRRCANSWAARRRVGHSYREPTTTTLTLLPFAFIYTIVHGVSTVLKTKIMNIILAC